MNHTAEYIGQRPFRSKVNLRAHTRQADRTTRTTELVGDVMRFLCASFLVYFVKQVASIGYTVD